MPNHLHLIISLTGGHGNPPLQSIVGLLKSFTTKKWNELIGGNFFELWQRSYYDHIIRNENEYKKIWEYIEENPARLANDSYYTV